MKALFILSMSTALLLFACSNTSSTATETVKENQEASASTDSIIPEELPLPSIPDTMREPAQRAAYLLQHFWDAMDFNDTLRSHNSAFMEQNFANFVSIFPHTDEQSRKDGVVTFLSRASVDPQAYQLIATIADHYLFDPNSPMYDEESYIPFLEQMLTSPLLDATHNTRLQYQLRIAKLNRPGMTAADFTYVTREGKRMNLRETKTNEFLLLLFYDPDCEHCQEVLPQVASSSVLNDMQNSGRLTILAVYADIDNELWQNTNAELPFSWIVGMDTGNISEKGLYSLRALPSLYLLDSHKTVILKDASIYTLENALMEMGN